VGEFSKPPTISPGGLFTADDIRQSLMQVLYRDYFFNTFRATELLFKLRSCVRPTVEPGEVIETLKRCTLHVALLAKPQVDLAFTLRPIQIYRIFSSVPFNEHKSAGYGL
jgi:hypothetical protein